MYTDTFSVPYYRRSPVHRLHTSSRHKVYDSLPPGMDPPSSGNLSSTQDPILGELPRGFHHLYTSIEYECASSLYQHYGSPRRTCLKTGRWSGSHVSCSPGEGSADLKKRCKEREMYSNSQCFEGMNRFGFTNMVPLYLIHLYNSVHIN